jgi:hypothetical protein
MKKSPKVIQAMEEFTDRMFQLYQDAEGLRDCTESGGEKAVFNNTRNSLHDLRFEAKKVLNKWKSE